jgi:hypothetical protein
MTSDAYPYACTTMPASGRPLIVPAVSALFIAASPAEGRSANTSAFVPAQRAGTTGRRDSAAPEPEQDYRGGAP